MKLKPIQFSQLHRSIKKGRGYSRLKKRYKKLYKWVNKPRTIRIKKWKIIVGAYIIWTLLPTAPVKAINSDPGINIDKPAQIITSHFQPIPAPAQPIAEVDTTPSPQPAQTSPINGCGDNFYANYIYMHESGCSLYNPNSNSGACGLGQAYPCSKLMQACPSMDYGCENAFFTSYAQKYGGWQGSYNFWINNHWW